VRLVIGRRLERLDENEKRVLAAAAVIGRSFSFQLLAEVSRIDVDELFNVIEKAQQMGIVVPSAEGPERPFTFGHELVRQTLLGGISAPRQLRLHAGVAEAIERLYPGAINERAGEVADHLLKAGSFSDNQRLVRYLTLAGKSALEAAAYDEARRSFRSALSHLGDVDVRERADLLARIATAERGLERWEVAFANLGEALEIYITLGDREMIAKGCTELAAVFVWAGRLQEAAETARRGLAYLEADVSADRARLLAILGDTLASAGTYQPAREALEEGLKIASQLSDPKLIAAMFGARSVANYLFLRLREAAADGERARGSEAPPWHGAVHLQVLCQTLLMLGRVKEGARLLDELEPLATKIGQSYSIARCIITRAWLDFGQEPNLAKLETALQQLTKSDPKVSFVFWDVFSRMQLSLVDFFRGNWDSALLHAQESFRLEVESSLLGSGVGTLFRQMAYGGDRAGALAILDEKRGWLPTSGRPNTSGSWSMLALAVEGLAILGENSRAGQLYPLVLELVNTGAVVLWSIFRFTQTVAGIAAASARQWDAAEVHFRTAMQQAESIPHRLEQAEVRRFHAMMLIDRAAAGDSKEARRLLGEAKEIYTQIGMPRHIEMTDTLLG